ncbi:MAG: hypothetical protein JSR97_10955 [Verrucomicrobia bacterium]|nr:hypothetical protein [Verrucomicrobiota bacterium]
MGVVTDLPTYGNPRAALQTPRFFDAQRNLKAFINDKDEVDALVKKIVLEALEIRGDEVVFKGPWAKV